MRRRCATFENGTRYQAGSYPVVVLSGSFYDMGRQYGELMKDELRGEHAMLVANLTERGYSTGALRDDAKEATALQPKRMKELQAGMAETSGLSEADVVERDRTSVRYAVQGGGVNPDGPIARGSW